MKFLVSNENQNKVTEVFSSVSFKKFDDNRMVFISSIRKGKELLKTLGNIIEKL